MSNMQQLTEEEIKNLLTLISRADIKGAEALPTSSLIVKLNGLLKPINNEIPHSTVETPKIEVVDEK